MRQAWVPGYVLVRGVHIDAVDAGAPPEQFVAGAHEVIQAAFGLWHTVRAGSAGGTPVRDGIAIHVAFAVTDMRQPTLTVDVTTL